jgi:hypothetical protein
MKILGGVFCVMGSLALLRVPSVRAQQTPPCPYSSQIDTTRLGSADSSRVQVIDGVFYRKGGQNKLEGFFTIDFYRKWNDPDAGMYNYPKEHTGYERGGFIDGLKEGPWKCVRYVPTTTTWWECYRAGQLVSTTAPPKVPTKGKQKAKAPRRSAGALEKNLA